MDPAAARALRLAYRATHHSPQACALFEKAVELCEHTSCTANLEYADALQELGDAQLIDGRASASLYHADKSVAVIAALDQSEVAVLKAFANGCAVRGRALHSLGRMAEALLEHKEALRRNEHLADTSGVISAQCNIGNLLGEVGELDDALRHMRLAESRALTAPQGELVYRQTLASIPSTVGDLLFSMNRLGDALVSFRLAKDRNIRLQGRDSKAVAYCSAQIGKVLLLVGDLAGAEMELRVAEAHFARSGWKDPKGAYCLIGLADLSAAKGDPRQALSFFKRGLAVLQSLFPPDHPYIANTRQRMSQLQDVLGQHANARASMTEATRIIRRSQSQCAGPGCVRRARSDGAPLDQCAGCCCTYYCSVACQAADWKRKGGHRKECKALVASGRAAAAAAAAVDEPAGL